MGPFSSCSFSGLLFFVLLYDVLLLPPHCHVLVVEAGKGVVLPNGISTMTATTEFPTRTLPATTPSVRTISLDDGSGIGLNDDELFSSSSSSTTVTTTIHEAYMTLQFFSKFPFTTEQEKEDFQKFIIGIYIGQATIKNGSVPIEAQGFAQDDGGDITMDISVPSYVAELILRDYNRGRLDGYLGASRYNYMTVTDVSFSTPTPHPTIPTDDGGGGSSSAKSKLLPILLPILIVVALVALLLLVAHKRKFGSQTLVSPEIEMPTFLDEHGFAPVHYATIEGNIELLKSIGESEHSMLDLSDGSGNNPLQLAAKHGVHPSLKYLLGQGVFVNHCNKEGDTALHLLCALQTDEQPPFLDLLNILLLSRIDTNIKNNQGQTALHIVCGLGLVEAAKMLLTHGADINAFDHDGFTPLVLAAKNGRENVVLCLSGKRRCIINHQDINGWSAMHWACALGELGCVDVLAKCLKTTMTLADLKGETCLHVAVRENNVNVVKMLVCHASAPRLLAARSLLGLAARDMARMVNGDNAALLASFGDVGASSPLSGDSLHPTTSPVLIDGQLPPLVSSDSSASPSSHSSLLPKPLSPLLDSTSSGLNNNCRLSSNESCLLPGHDKRDIFLSVLPAHSILSSQNVLVSVSEFEVEGPSLHSSSNLNTDMNALPIDSHSSYSDTRPSFVQSHFYNQNIAFNSVPIEIKEHESPSKRFRVEPEPLQFHEVLPLEFSAPPVFVSIEESVML